MFEYLQKLDPAWLASLTDEAQNRLRQTPTTFGGRPGTGAYNMFTGGVRLGSTDDANLAKHEAMHALAAKLPYPAGGPPSPQGTHTVERGRNRYGGFGTENWDEPIPNTGFTMRQAISDRWNNDRENSWPTLAAGFVGELWGKSIYDNHTILDKKGGEQFVGPMNTNAIQFDPSRLPVEMQSTYAPFFRPEAMKQKYGTLAEAERQSRGVPPIMVQASSKPLMRPAATINTIRRAPKRVKGHTYQDRGR